MAEPEKVQMIVTVSQGRDKIIVDLDPEDLINLRPDETTDKVSITLAGNEIALLQRFSGPIGGSNAELN